MLYEKKTFELFVYTKIKTKIIIIVYLLPMSYILMVVWVKLDNLDKNNGSILNFPKSLVLFKV